MELLMQEFHMYLLDIKSRPKLNGQHDNREMSSIRLNLLTKTTWKLKTAGGILVFQLLVQVWICRDLSKIWLDYILYITITKLVLNMTVFVIKRTEFYINMTGFVLNDSVCSKKYLDFPKYVWICTKYV